MKLLTGSHLHAVVYKQLLTVLSGWDNTKAMLHYLNNKM